MTYIRKDSEHLFNTLESFKKTALHRTQLPGTVVTVSYSRATKLLTNFVTKIVTKFITKFDDKVLTKFVTKYPKIPSSSHPAARKVDSATTFKSRPNKVAGKQKRTRKAALGQRA